MSSSYTLSLHDALPISLTIASSRTLTLTNATFNYTSGGTVNGTGTLLMSGGTVNLSGDFDNTNLTLSVPGATVNRPEEHTSEIQPPSNLIWTLMPETSK